MINKSNKPIDLSESITLALETLRQALQIYFGKEIVFVKNNKVYPNRIRDYNDGTQSRMVIVRRQFLTIDSDGTSEPDTIYAEVEMTKGGGPDDVWKTQRLNLVLGDTAKPEPVTSLWAHVIGTQRLLPTLRVCNKTGLINYQQYWRVGRTIADRHYKPIDFKGWGEY